MAAPISSSSHGSSHSASLPFETRWSLGPPNDTGRVIQNLLVSRPVEEYSQHLFHNLKAIGERVGFTVTPSAPDSRKLQSFPFSLDSYPVRDPKCRAYDGAVLSPSFSPTLTQSHKPFRPPAIDRASLRAGYRKDDSASCTEHPLFKRVCLGSVAMRNYQGFARDGLQKEVRAARSYFEGGNILASDGVFLIGDRCITVTHMLLRMNGWFSVDFPVSGPIESEEDLLAFTEKHPGQEHVEGLMSEWGLMQKYNDRLNKLFLSGKIPSILKEKAEKIGETLSEETVLATLGEMNEMFLLNGVYYTTLEDKRKGRAIAANYLAQRQFVLEEIFPTDLRVHPSQVIEIPQIAYHLDCMMMLGPDRTIFLQDYEEVVHLLEKIQSQDGDLTPQDHTKLSLLIVEAKKLNKDLGPLLKKTRKILEETGMGVIPTPGVLFGPATPQEPDAMGPENHDFEMANFLNAITGYSAKDGTFYCITAGSDIGDHLGKVLMDSYASFIKEHLPDANVYFVGENPTKPGDFSETHLWGKLLLGPRCLTFELETKAHPDCV